MNIKALNVSLLSFSIITALFPLNAMATKLTIEQRLELLENELSQSVCSFLNRFGGDIYLGVEDDGTVCGVPENAAGDMVKNFIKIISNPNMFTPTIYLSPEIIKYEGKTIIHIHIPISAEVHSFKKEVYDRVDDADVKVTATAQLAMMYIRK